MAELEEVLDDALSGRGRIVMLAGEPGIGKTRLAQELAFPVRNRRALRYFGAGATNVKVRLPIGLGSSRFAPMFSKQPLPS